MGYFVTESVFLKACFGLYWKYEICLFLYTEKNLISMAPPFGVSYIERI
jgi:hypothetical protein